jgi:hypothetical protein
MILQSLGALLGILCKPARKVSGVMADVSDVRAQKLARSEFARRQVDVSRAQVNVHHGVLYIRGEVLPMIDASYSDMESEMNLIARILRQRSEIRDVVIDAQFRSTPVRTARTAA